MPRRPVPRANSIQGQILSRRPSLKVCSEALPSGFGPEAFPEGFGLQAHPVQPQYAQEYHTLITLCRQGSLPTCFAVVFGDSQAFMSRRPKCFSCLACFCTDVCTDVYRLAQTSPPHPSTLPRFLGLRFACGGGFVSGFGLGFRTYLPRPPEGGNQA